jgi:hypothetical protein
MTKIGIIDKAKPNIIHENITLFIFSSLIGNPSPNVDVRATNNIKIIITPKNFIVPLLLSK